MAKLELPKKLGRPRAIAGPDELWDLAMDYFKEVDENPGYINKLITSGDLAGCIIPVPAKLPYTWSGLDVYLFKRGVISSLDEHRLNRDGKYDDFSSVIQLIAKTMRTQKFDGATIGIFKENIIAMDLGLAQKTIVETTDKTDKFDYNDLSDSALEEIQAARLKAKQNEGA